MGCIFFFFVWGEGVGVIQITVSLTCVRDNNIVAINKDAIDCGYLENGFWTRPLTLILDQAEIILCHKFRFGHMATLFYLKGYFMSSYIAIAQSVLILYLCTIRPAREILTHYLLHWRVAKAQMSLCTRTVSPEHSLLQYTKDGNTGMVRRQVRPLVSLETSEWACKKGFCAYARSSRNSNADSNMVLQIRKISWGFYFRETSQMRSFVNINPSRNDLIFLSVTDGKSSHNRDFYVANVSFNGLREKMSNLQFDMLKNHHSLVRN